DPYFVCKLMSLSIFPERGLRGGVFYCDQTLLAIHTPTSREIYADYREAIDRHVESFDVPTSKAVEPLPGDTVSFLSRWEHEADHLRRHLATSLGFLFHHLQLWHTLALEREFPVAIRVRPEAPFPVFTRSQVRDLANFWTGDLRDDLARYGREPLAHREKLLYVSQNILARSLFHPVEERQVCAAILALSRYNLIARSALPESSCKFAEDWRGGVASAGNLSAPAIDEAIFTGEALFEFMAVVEEMSIEFELQRQRPLGASAAYDLMIAETRYNCVSRLWLGMFPEIGSRWDRALVATNTPRRPFHFARMYPIELFAVVDLALWIPVGPQGIQSSRGVLSWADIDPGHRFLRAMKLLRSRYSGASFHWLSSNYDADNRVFVDAQNQFADHFGWPRAGELAASWLSFLQRGNAAQPLAPLFLTHPGAARMEAARRLLKYRQKD